MQAGAVEFIDFNLNMGNSILHESAATSKTAFADMLEEKIKEATISDEDKKTDAKNDKSTKKQANSGINKNLKAGISILQDARPLRNENTLSKTYSLLDKLKDRQPFEEEINPEEKKDLNQSPNVVGHAFAAPINSNNGRQMSRSQMLSIWDRMAPTVTEDANRKTVRIDIPLVKDIRALVLKMHSDGSITASVLASDSMAELIRQNKDKLEKALKSHNLELRDFKAYKSDLTFNQESGSRKKKRNKFAATNDLKMDIF